MKALFFGGHPLVQVQTQKYKPEPSANQTNNSRSKLDPKVKTGLNNTTLLIVPSPQMTWKCCN